ncbi:fic family toxin-antitoxin system, toxin component [Streptomyces sp. KM273126]|uniref:fic family toxin-antitoxin system, toxin component n=1 Tax=Streptomyces sp. KM273126 TaxID=2545247 RepID=UPI00215DBA24|nr:fic family toxin-antitoxin system, toxin component [Streptomyces sp. KM273126]
MFDQKSAVSPRRSSSELLGTDALDLLHPVDGGPYARAAALVHTLGRCRWLEHSNLTVACALAVMYLEASNIPVSPTCEQLTAPAHELNNPGCTAEPIATFLPTRKP